MHLMNILLTIGLIALISGISVLSICALIASSRSQEVISSSQFPPNHIERRRNNTKKFPVVCEDGTMVYFDRRLRTDRRFA